MNAVKAACRWCGNLGSGRLCDECAKSHRLKRMVAPYRIAIAYDAGYERCHALIFSPLDIFERDEWVCGICGEEIDRFLCAPDAWSACIDHIVPFPRGEHTPENVRAAHLRCNVQRARRKDHTEAEFPLRFLTRGESADVLTHGQTRGDTTADEAEESIRRQAARGAVRRALDALPDAERRVIELRWGIGNRAGPVRSHDAISDELGLPRDRVYQLERRALSQLAALHELAGLAA